MPAAHTPSASPDETACPSRTRTSLRPRYVVLRSPACASVTHVPYKSVLKNSLHRAVCQRRNVLPCLAGEIRALCTDFACEAGENVSALTDGTVQAVF